MTNDFRIPDPPKRTKTQTKMKDTNETFFPFGPKHYKWYFRLASTAAARKLETEWILNLAKKAGVEPVCHIGGGCIAQWDGQCFRITNSYNVSMTQYCSEHLIIEFFKEYKDSASKYIDINNDDSTMLSNRSVRKLRVYKTGVKVLDFYEHKIGWIYSEDILACADAIEELRKR